MAGVTENACVRNRHDLHFGSEERATLANMGKEMNKMNKQRNQ